VQVQVGGSFFLSEEDMQGPLLFIAGGIGITPLHAMLAHLVQQLPHLACAQAPAAQLLYSSGTEEELVLKEELLKLATGSRGEAMR
jgi:ferredoxin-NADP reductase